MMKKLIPLIASVAVLVPLFFMHSCANTTEAPTGGLKDTIPPYIIDINPLPGAVNVPLKNARFIFTFNEYVSVKTPANIVLSPPQLHPFKTRMQGKNLVVIVDEEEELLPNTTYTITFTDAVADVNEGNMFPGFSYVFSTGEHIDSMMVTGTVRDCNTLSPFKGATVMLYKDLSDSALFLHRPDAATKTDDWGYFRLPFVADTTYRLYAIKDEANNFIYDPENDLVAFVDSIIRPVIVVNDTLPEMLNYEMTDTLSCQERRSEHELILFREKPTKQYLKNEMRTADRAAYITFMAPNAWVDTMWISGFRNDQLITEFNLQQDSMLIWVNSRKAMPDTLHLYVNYRKTDSLGVLKPELEHKKLFIEGKAKTRNTYQARKNIKHTDTICVMKVKAVPETVEQEGISIEFDYPVINESFDSLKFISINTRQRQNAEKYTVERDSLNLRRYVIRPSAKLQKGFEYVLKVPHRAFRDINGFYSDSTEVKVSLPSDDKLSTLVLEMGNVDRKIIVDLLDEKDATVRSYVVDRNTRLEFPYLKTGKYSVRVTEDSNRNSLVDVGSVLEHRQSEKVVFYQRDGKKFIDIPEGAEISQTIDLNILLK